MFPAVVSDLGFTLRYENELCVTHRPGRWWMVVCARKGHSRYCADAPGTRVLTPPLGKRLATQFPYLLEQRNMMHDGWSKMEWNLLLTSVGIKTYYEFRLSVIISRYPGKKNTQGS